MIAALIMGAAMVAWPEGTLRFFANTIGVSVSRNELAAYYAVFYVLLFLVVFRRPD